MSAPASGPASDQFDAIVIGGGHHGTIISCYLARAGLRVGVFEAHSALGGGAGSEDGPAPGFRQDFCAHIIRFYSHPANRDFNLRDEGLEYIFPQEYSGSPAREVGMLFDDGTAYLGYAAHELADPKDVTAGTQYKDDNVTRNYEQIREFSPRDAETYVGLVEAYRTHWRPALHSYKYSSPPPWGTPDALEELLTNPGSRLDPVYLFMSMRQVAFDLFESDQLRTILLREALTSGGVFGDDNPGLEGILHYLISALSFEQSALVKGGTQGITDALVSAGTKLGATYHTGAEVDRIVLESGKAVGVELANGDSVRAPLVVSALGVPQTYMRLLRGEGISDLVARRISNIHYDRGQILWGNIAFHEAPEYTAEARYPGIGQQARLYHGQADGDYLASKYQHDAFILGIPQQIYPLVTPDTLWDPTRAPESKHSYLVEEFTAPARFFSANEWNRLKQEYIDSWLDKWQSYAPNMTRDNIIATRLYSPYDVEVTHPDMVEGGWTEGSQIASQLGRFRPLPELANYRTPFEGVYICSSNLHSAGGLGQSSSVNAFKVIAEDRGLGGS